MRTRNAFMNQIEQGNKLEQTLLHDKTNRKELQHKIGIFLRRQRHPAMSADWGDFATHEDYELRKRLEDKYEETHTT